MAYIDGHIFCAGGRDEHGPLQVGRSPLLCLQLSPQLRLRLPIGHGCPRILLQSVERLRNSATAFDPRGHLHQEAWMSLPDLRVPRVKFNCRDSPHSAHHSVSIAAAGSSGHWRISQASPAAVACDGQLLVIGGVNTDGFLESCEAYDELLQKWEPRMAMVSTPTHVLLRLCHCFPTAAPSTCHRHSVPERGPLFAAPRPLWLRRRTGRRRRRG